MNGNLFSDPALSAADAPGEDFTAHCDGGSRGNPGPSGYGAVVEDAHGHVVAQLSQFLGLQTNNYAEYSGLLAVLQWAIEHHARRLCVISDSELMVKQMQGKYAVKSPVLRPLYEEARKLSRRVQSFEMRHTLRGGNKEADRLANEAMDKGMGKITPPRVGKPSDFVAARQQGSGASGASGVGDVSGVSGVSNGSRSASQQASKSAPAAKPAPQILEGYVKNGVVHLVEGELPDGIFVKVIRE
jgi:probable phosphoglycerate mutase